MTVYEYYLLNRNSRKDCEIIGAGGGWYGTIDTIPEKFDDGEIIRCDDLPDKVILTIKQ